MFPAALFLLFLASGEADVRAALARGTGTVQLPAGETHLNRPLDIPKGALHLHLRAHPSGSTLVLDRDFEGSAAIVADAATGLDFSGFAIRGNRTELKSDWYLPLREAAFADFYSANGILIRNSRQVSLKNLRFSDIRSFPILIHASADVTIDSVKIEDCGTLTRAGRNNTTGGILLEEGVARFQVLNSSVNRVAGNAIWTHSYARSPRASDGAIRGNLIRNVARDAIQVGHATRVRVERNSGSDIGYPTGQVDVENFGTPVALDTAGNVDASVYRGNTFTGVNGQCIDLDGFHDGEVTGNSCTNGKPASAYPSSHYAILFGNHDPGMQSTGVTLSGNILDGFAYGAVFLIGSHNRIENNRFLNINRARCGSVPISPQCNYALDQPDLLRSGIYLSGNGGRSAPVEDNIVRGNRIEGFGMSRHCIAVGPGVDPARNLISNNTCSE